MANARAKMNSAGARAVLNSSGVQGDLLRRAENIKAAAEGFGSGVYVADVQPGKNRARAMVKTTGIESRKSNAKHNSLLKSLDAGR